MTKAENPKRYNLEERTFKFAENVRGFVRKLPKTIANIEDAKQLIRSSGSVGANYIEANEALGKKDFLMKIRTCRKESKESSYWLRLLNTGGKSDLDNERKALAKEATEPTSIFGAILRNSE